jgi:hypothetical protein
VPTWFAVLGVVVALLGGLITYQLRGSVSAPSPSGPFDLTVQIEGPVPATGGMVILHLGERQVRAHIASSRAYFKDLPAEYRGRPVKVAALTEPELEATWKPHDLLALDPPLLTLRMLAERPPFQVVAIYRPSGAATAQAKVLERLRAGSGDATVAAFVQRAVASLRATGVALPRDAEFTAFSLAKRRWLTGPTSLETLGLDESRIVLVHASVRAPGDRPEDYAPVAQAALGSR